MFKDYERFFKKTIAKVFAVFLVFKISDVMLMKSIRQQIIEAKREKTEREKELWFVDYCNNCKTGLASKCDVPCHHPYYCWHEGESAIVQADIVGIDEYRRLNGHITAQMNEEYKKSRKRQRQLIWQGRKELLEGS